MKQNTIKGRGIAILSAILAVLLLLPVIAVGETDIPTTTEVTTEATTTTEDAVIFDLAAKEAAEAAVPSGNTPALLSLDDTMLSVNYITPETFGASGNGSVNDYNAVVACLAHAKTNGQAVRMEKSYNLGTNDLLLDGVRIEILGTIKTTGTITITNGSRVVGGIIDGANVIIDNYGCEFAYCTLKNYVGTGIVILEKGTENEYNGHNPSCHNLRITNAENRVGKDSLGIQILSCDAKIANIMIVNAYTAFTIERSNVYLDNVYAWNNSYVPWEGSTYCKISAANYTLVNCTNDSYSLCFDVRGWWDIGHVDNFMFLNNNILFHDKTFRFINKFAAIYGDAWFRFDDFSAYNNKFEVGSGCYMNMTPVNGNFSDKKMRLASGNIVSSRGGTVEGHAMREGSLVNVDVMVNFSDYISFGTSNPLYLDISTLDSVNKIDFDILVPAIYVNSNGSWSDGVARAICDPSTGGKIKIVPVINDTAHSKLKRVSVNISTMIIDAQ